MNIRLNETKVSALVLEHDSSVSDGHFDFSYSQGYLEDEPTKFLIRFESVIGIEDGVKIAITFDAEFDCDEEVTESFKESHFPKVNAPAIAFPYLRTFLSNLTLNAGYKTVILPAINFQALAKKLDKKE